MRVVLATPLYAPDWEWGGVVTWAAQLFPALARRRHQVTVVTTRVGADRLPEEEMQGVLVVRTEGEILGSSGRVRSPGYEAACREHFSRADIVHIAGVWQPAGNVAARVARDMKVPYGISPHGALGPYAWTRNRLMKWGYYHFREKGHLSRAAWIHATAPLEEEEMKLLGWRKNVRVVPNPLDTDFWVWNPEEGNAWRRRLGVGEDEFVLLSCGRLHHKKGLELLPEVLARVEGKWKWILIGDDRNGVRGELQARLRAFRLEGRAVWLDSSPPGEVRAAYAGSDCLLMPSLHENFGNVAVEAAACGCRALVSDQVGAAAWMEGVALPREIGLWRREIRRFVGAGREDPAARRSRSDVVSGLLGSAKVAQAFELAMMQAVATMAGKGNT
ncbi:MAG: glycosyltransferase [Terrimicrobiaceae bacterium]